MGLLYRLFRDGGGVEVSRRIDELPGRAYAGRRCSKGEKQGRFPIRRRRIIHLDEEYELLLGSRENNWTSVIVVDGSFTDDGHQCLLSSRHCEHERGQLYCRPTENDCRCHELRIEHWGRRRATVSALNTQSA